jgi:hypothetical protein
VEATSKSPYRVGTGKAGEILRGRGQSVSCLSQMPIRVSQRVWNWEMSLSCYKGRFSHAAGGIRMCVKGLSVDVYFGQLIVNSF